MTVCRLSKQRHEGKPMWLVRHSVQQNHRSALAADEIVPVELR